MTKRRIHVRQDRIRANIRAPQDRREPPIVVREGKRRLYGNTVEVSGPCRIVYSPDRPMDCGARLWIETEAAVEIIA